MRRASSGGAFACQKLEANAQTPLIVHSLRLAIVSLGIFLAAPRQWQGVVVCVLAVAAVAWEILSRWVAREQTRLQSGTSRDSTQLDMSTSVQPLSSHPLQAKIGMGLSRHMRSSRKLYGDDAFAADECHGLSTGWPGAAMTLANLRNSLDDGSRSAAGPESASASAFANIANLFDPCSAGSAGDEAVLRSWLTSAVETQHKTCHASERMDGGKSASEILEPASSNRATSSVDRPQVEKSLVKNRSSAASSRKARAAGKCSSITIEAEAELAALRAERELLNMLDAESSKRPKGADRKKGSTNGSSDARTSPALHHPRADSPACEQHAKPATTAQQAAESTVNTAGDSTVGDGQLQRQPKAARRTQPKHTQSRLKAGTPKEVAKDQKDDRLVALMDAVQKSNELNTARRKAEPDEAELQSVHKPKSGEMERPRRSNGQNRHNSSTLEEARPRSPTLDIGSTHSQKTEYIDASKAFSASPISTAICQNVKIADSCLTPSTQVASGSSGCDSDSESRKVDSVRKEKICSESLADGETTAPHCLSRGGSLESSDAGDFSETVEVNSESKRTSLASACASASGDEQKDTRQWHVQPAIKQIFQPEDHLLPRRGADAMTSMAQELRSKFPDAKIVMGGGDLSACDDAWPSRAAAQVKSCLKPEVPLRPAEISNMPLRPGPVPIKVFDSLVQAAKQLPVAASLMGPASPFAAAPAQAAARCCYPGGGPMLCGTLPAGSSVPVVPPASRRNVDVLPTGTPCFDSSPTANLIRHGVGTSPSVGRKPSFLDDKIGKASRWRDQLRRQGDEDRVRCHGEAPTAFTCSETTHHSEVLIIQDARHCHSNFGFDPQTYREQGFEQSHAAEMQQVHQMHLQGPHPQQHVQYQHHQQHPQQHHQQLQQNHHHQHQHLQQIDQQHRMVVQPTQPATPPQPYPQLFSPAAPVQCSVDVDKQCQDGFLAELYNNKKDVFFGGLPFLQFADHADEMPAFPVVDQMTRAYASSDCNAMPQVAQITQTFPTMPQTLSHAPPQQMLSSFSPVASGPCAPVIIDMSETDVEPVDHAQLESTGQYSTAYQQMYQGMLAARLTAAAPEYYED